MAGWRTLPERRMWGHGERGPKGILPKNRTSLWSLDCLPEEDDSCSWPMNFNTAMSLSLPRASPYPLSLSFGVKISNADVFSILQHCPLKGGVYFIDVKKSHMWTWRVALGIAWRTWLWARNSDRMVTWPTSLRRKECILWVGERTKMPIGWPKYWVVVDTHSLISSS